jgi:hypothetical protein
MSKNRVRLWTADNEGRPRVSRRCAHCENPFEPVTETQRCCGSKCYKADYNATNRERIVRNRAAYYAANRATFAERSAAYYAANRERLLNQQAAYYAANRARIAKRKAANRAAKRGRLKDLTTGKGGRK